MAKAVRRVQGASPVSLRPHSVVDPYAAYATSFRVAQRRRREKRVVFAVLALAVLVVASGATLAGVEIARHIGTSPPSRTASTSSPSSGHSGSASSSPSSSTSTTLPVPTPVGAPVLASLDPSQDSAGQTLAVTGSNFISSNGEITASFGGQTAPTSCPSETSCSVTVPPMTGTSTSVPVTITTASGTSNSLMFTYQ